ncbi:MAG: chain length determinant protein tyrosine kinase EpsG [Pseudomonadales bacterium]|nr:chain length determinant protein tyrosine kinase EpsG [Pseudomonadales bacterium]
MNSVVNSAGIADTAKSIGAILIDSGLIDASAAEKVLQLQKQEPQLRFGDAAIRLGLLTEQELLFALSQQFVYPYLLKKTGISGSVVAAYEPFNPMVEQLRELRSQLLLRWFTPELDKDNTHQSSNALAILSATPGEGRSFVAANLAVVFSQLGQRTLLVDADLRSGCQHQLFDVSNKVGFSTLLAGRTDLAAAIQRVEGLLSLSVLPSGAIPPNPQELLNRPLFSHLMKLLEENYDVVILDTPAASDFSDAYTLARGAKAGLVVASRNRTAVADVNALAQTLAENQVTMVGALLNKA